MRQYAGTLFISTVVCLAASFPQYTFDRLTDDSEIVASGRITRTWTAWDSEHKYIWTHYELSVSETHKGASQRTIDIAEPGGSLDGIATSVPGAASYSIGERVFVFLSRVPTGYLRTAGFGLGKFIVDTAGRLHGGSFASAAVRPGPAIASEIRSINGLSVGEASGLVHAHSVTGGVR